MGRGMSAVVVGIDPGLNGAVAVIANGKARVFAMPTSIISATRREVDSVVLLHTLLDLPEGEPTLAVLEKVNGQPGWGASNFIFGSAYGAARSVLQIGGWELIDVRPQGWKPVVLGPGPKWSKKQAIDWVLKHYPGTNLKPVGSWTPSHDWAEAVCLAHYGVINGKSSGSGVHGKEGKWQVNTGTTSGRVRV